MARFFMAHGVYAALIAAYSVLLEDKCLVLHWLVICSYIFGWTMCGIIAMKNGMISDLNCVKVL